MAYDLITKKRSARNWALGASSIGAPLIVYDEEMMAELNNLRRDVDALNDDFTAWFKKNQGDLQARNLWKHWTTFRDDVYGTYKSWTDTTLLLTPGGSVHSYTGRRKFYDNVKNLQEQESKWRKDFERLTGQAPSAPSALDTKKPDDSSGSLWKWAAILGLGAFGGVLVARKLGA